MSDGLGRVLVIIPTYNERENLEEIVTGIRATAPPVEVLVVDDASPDGTGHLAETLAAGDERVHVVHRPRKEGLGSAYLSGFRWALARGYDYVVEMDADGSHRPRDLSRLLDAAPRYDLVIGSRWIPGGAIHNWPKARQWLSRAGNTYARILLDLPVCDATAGLRVFTAAALGKLGLDEVRSQGYCFQVDLVSRAVDAGLRVAEVPITFAERTKGTSKMSRAVVAEALWRITAWGVRRRVAGRRGSGRR